MPPDESSRADSNPDSRGDSILGEALEADPAVRESVSRLAYENMRQIARGYLSRERPGHTLEPTALVHEAYLRLVQDGVDPKHRSLFLAYGAREMRRVLVDHARVRKAAKRGGGWARMPLTGFGHDDSSRAVEVLDLDSALERLREHSERQAEIVELRFFSGLEIEDLSELLGLSVSTVEREWRLARARLFRLLQAWGTHES